MKGIVIYAPYLAMGFLLRLVLANTGEPALLIIAVIVLWELSEAWSSYFRREFFGDDG